MPSQATPQSPPPLPNMPDVGPTLSNYLRQFSLWCRHGFSSKLDASTALPGVLLQANDAPAGTTPKVFMVVVNSAGAISATPVALGGGKP